MSPEAGPYWPPSEGRTYHTACGASAIGSVVAAAGADVVPVLGAAGEAATAGAGDPPTAPPDAAAGATGWNIAAVLVGALGAGVETSGL